MPESFKVLVKELQSLALDIRVLDKEGNEIELSTLGEEESDAPVYVSETESEDVSSEYMNASVVNDIGENHDAYDSEDEEDDVFVSEPEENEFGDGFDIGTEDGILTDDENN